MVLYHPKSDLKKETHKFLRILTYRVSQNRCNLLIRWWFITETSAMMVIWSTSRKKIHLWARDIKSMFFNCYYISFQDMQSFFEYLASKINHYHIKWLHLFWDSFEWFCPQISSDAKSFFFSCPRHCDQWLIVVIVYYFQIWNKKNTRLLLVELFAVTWFPCILRHPYTNRSPNLSINRSINRSIYLILLIWLHLYPCSLLAKKHSQWIRGK